MGYSKSKQIEGLYQVSDDLLNTIGFSETYTRNEFLYEICPMIKFVLNDLGLGSRLDDTRNIYKNNLIRGTKEDIIDSASEIAEKFEEVANAIEDEETPYEVEERFEQEVLSKMSLEDREDKPRLRLLFSVWIDTQVRDGNMTEELASDCAAPIDCY